MKAKSIIIVFLLIFVFPAFSQAEKPVISILDFELSNVAKSDAQVIMNYLSAYLVNSGKFRVIDRSQRDIILSEFEFSLSGCTDISCQVEVGKMLAADELLVGSIGEIGDRFLLTLKIIDVESSETVKNISRKYLDINTLIDDCSSLVLGLIGLENGEMFSDKPAQTESVQEIDLEEILIATTRLVNNKAYRKKDQIPVIQEYSEQLSFEYRYLLYEKNEMKGSLLYAGLNTVYGLGSWLQGDITGGLVVTGLMGVGMVASIAGALQEAGRDPDSDSTNLLLIGGLCSVLAGTVTGWIIPFFFESNNNKNLKKALLMD